MAWEKDAAAHLDENFADHIGLEADVKKIATARKRQACKVCRNEEHRMLMCVFHIVEEPMASFMFYFSWVDNPQSKKAKEVRPLLLQMITEWSPIHTVLDLLAQLLNADSDLTPLIIVHSEQQISANAKLFFWRKWSMHAAALTCRFRCATFLRMELRYGQPDARFFEFALRAATDIAGMMADSRRWFDNMDAHFCCGGAYAKKAKVFLKKPEHLVKNPKMLKPFRAFPARISTNNLSSERLHAFNMALARSYFRPPHTSLHCGDLKILVL